ncbi:MAG: glycoside hydrolase family 2 TIM barrel-domain containing protein [Burkholderiaceae bacterium]
MRRDFLRSAISAAVAAVGVRAGIADERTPAPGEPAGSTAATSGPASASAATSATNATSPASATGAAADAGSADGAGTALLSPLYPQANRHRAVLDLSGLWAFQTDPQQRGERERWFERLPSPRTIAVPGSWNEQYPDLDGYLGPAWYWREIELPADWAGRRLRLRFGSATWRARVWLDGRLLGEHGGGHLPFEFDLGVLAPDTVDPPPRRILAVEVDNTPSPSRVPPGAIGGDGGNYPNVAYDFYPYAGLHRQVWLTALPDPAIEDFGITTRRIAAPGRADARVSLRVRARAGWSGRGRARLWSPPAVRGDARTATASSDRAPAGDQRLRFADGEAETIFDVPMPRWWSPDDPALYRLRIELHDADGRPVDAYEDDIGLRTIEVRGDRLLLNDAPIRLRGFGRHEDFPANGRGLNTSVAVQDLALIRWVGGNSFRTSHYPYSEETMRLADREGLLVIDEVPAVGLFFSDAQPLIDARLAQVRRQVDELIARDKNRACVIMWSLANEPMDDGYVAGAMRGKVDGGDGYKARGRRFFDELFAYARSRDDTRPLTIAHAPFSDGSWQEHSDVLCLNRYGGWYDNHGRLDQAMPGIVDELEALHRRTGKPIMLTEFGADAIAGMHAIGDGIWSEEYQARMIGRYLDVAETRPWIVGLHVWNLADFRTAQALGRPGGLNHKGVFTRDRRPKMAAHLLRSRWRTSP